MSRRLRTSAACASDTSAAGIYGSHRLRIGDVVHRAVEHQPALMQHHDTGRDFAHEVEVMLDQNDRVARFRREISQDRADGRALRLGEARGRLVKQMSRGSSARTMASSSACFMPCDRGPAGEAIRSVRPVSRRTANARGWQREKRREADPARRFGGRSSEPQALGDGQASKMLATWNSRPTPSATARRRQSPDGLVRNLDHALERLGAVAEKRIEVVLPAPFGPTMPTSSPGRISRLSFRARKDCQTTARARRLSTAWPTSRRR